VSSKDTVKLFFIDSGSVMHVKMSSIYKIAPSYDTIPPLAYRAALTGIEPSPAKEGATGTKLWPLIHCIKLAKKLSKRQVVVTIASYHADCDFYEVEIEVESVKMSEKLVAKGVAIESDTFWENDDPVSCISYPPFEFLEKFDYYPTLRERCYLFFEKNVGFNAFEEEFVDVSICNQKGLELAEALKKSLKEAFAQEKNKKVYAGFLELIKSPIKGFYNCI
jgi:hypothetical protein